MRHPDAAELLAAGRITVFGLWFLHVLSTPLTLFSDLPFDLFAARGVLGLLPRALFATLASSPALLLAMKAALLVGCLLLVLGVRPFRPVAIPVALLLLLFDGMLKGFNAFINHAQMGMLFAAILLCFFPAADALSVMGRRRNGAAAPEVYAGGVLVVAAFLCAAYAFIGTHRVVSGGWEIFTGDAIITYLAVQSLNYSAYGFEFGLLALTYPLLGVFFKIGFAVTTLFEILSPLTLINRWFRWLWLLVIVPFHLSTLLTMNIFFWENILLIAVFIVPLGHLYASLEAGGARGAVGGFPQAARTRASISSSSFPA